MKKNKTVAFMLAATLMVGGTFLGTKAWFTDQDTVNNKLLVTMGSFDLQVDETSKTEDGKYVPGWKLARAEGENNEYEESKGPKDGYISGEFTNIRPGDSFEREYTITNNGNLDQMLYFYKDKDKTTKFEDDSITLNPKDTTKSLYKLEVKSEDNALTNGMILKSENSVKVKLILTPNAENLTIENQSKPLILDDLKLGEIFIDAKQVNHQDNPAVNPLTR